MWYCCDWMLVCMREHLINYSWLASEVLAKWLEGVLGREGTPSSHTHIVCPFGSWKCYKIWREKLESPVTLQDREDMSGHHCNCHTNKKHFMPEWGWRALTMREISVPAILCTEKKHKKWTQLITFPHVLVWVYSLRFSVLFCNSPLSSWVTLLPAFVFAAICLWNWDYPGRFMDWTLPLYLLCSGFVLFHVPAS